MSQPGQISPRDAGESGERDLGCLVVKAATHLDRAQGELGLDVEDVMEDSSADRVGHD